MNKSAFSLSIMFIGLIIFFLIFSILCIFYFYWGNLKAIQDSLSTTGSIFSAIATLGAAALAAYLFNDWRDEKNYELENYLLTNILMDLKPIFVELHKIRSDSKNLKKIDNNFIVKTNYLERERIDIFKSIISLFPNIKIYSEIKKDKELINLYNLFDKHCFILEDFYRDLFFTRYRRYYELVTHEIESKHDNNKKSYDIFRKYSENRKNYLRIEIEEILNIFKKNALKAYFDEEIIDVTYELWVEETILMHNKIQDYCIKHLRATKK